MFSNLLLSESVGLCDTVVALVGLMWFILFLHSLYLFKLGRAPQIEDLYGKINFTEEELSAMRRELDKYGIQMPAFSKIGGILANEVGHSLDFIVLCSC